MSGDLEVEGYRIGDLLPSLAASDLSGGAFGQVHLAVNEDGEEVVAKLCRRRGGGRSNTIGVGFHYPAIGIVPGDPPVHRTFAFAGVAAVARNEAELLERADGELFPKLHAMVDHPDRGPILFMERLGGHRPDDPRQFVELLERLAELAAAGRVDFHGDLKPEHVFVTGDGEVRLVDPAPRLEGERPAGFTPEYNPLALAGPEADVAAVAAMLYELLSGTAPFPDAREPGGGPSPALPALPRPDRGRPQVPRALADWVSWVLDPRGLPRWARSHREAADWLRAAIDGPGPLPP